MTYLLRFFRRLRSRFGEYQRQLHQAGILTPYDRYLTRAVRQSVAVAALGAIAASVLFVYIGPRTAVAVGVAGLFLGGCVFSGWYLYPSVRSTQRRREIDRLLPYAVVSIYVLSRSGLSPVEVINRVADAGIYGELSTEFESIRRDVTYYGDDLLTALETAEKRTPSERLATFLSDLQATIQSQTSFEEFVYRANERQFEEMAEKQDAFIERLKTFAQVYILVTFVAPLLVLVFLVLLSFGTGDTLVFTVGVAYVYPVVAILATLAVLDRLGRQVSLSHSQPTRRTDEDMAPPPDTDGILKAYRRARWRRTVREWRPLATFRRRPPTTLAVSIPVVSIAAAGSSYALDLDLSAFVRQSPVVATAVVVGCGIAAVVPLVVFHGARRSTQQSVVRRIPETCEALGEATHTGRTPVESCHLVGEEGEGPLAAELRAVAREARLTGDLTPALWSMADRLGVPDLTLTVSTIIEAVQVTTDLEVPMSILADAAETRAELARARRRSMELYGVVVAFGLLVFIMVAFFLTLVFFPQLSGVRPIEGSPLQAPAIDAETYQVILFHASIIQAGGNGFVVGKLRDGDALSGLKYSVAFLTVVTAAFLVLTVL